jgi:predicted nucleic acid-binding protein
VIYILDACALIAVLKNESEMPKVKALFVQANNGTASILMHIVNKMEVYYGFITDRGLLEANKLMKIVDELPVKYIYTINRKVYKTGCRLKGTYNISLADSIAAAVAYDRGAVLVTKDGEFKPLQEKERLPVFWLRQPKKKGA